MSTVNNDGGLFKEKHFKNFAGFVITAENTTTQTQVGAPGSLKIVEVLKKGFLLDVPPKCCAAGHFLLVKVFPPMKLELIKGDSRGPTPILTVTGKILAQEPVGEKSPNSLITLEFVQLDPKEWSAFLGELVTKQNEVNKLLKEMKD